MVSPNLHYAFIISMSCLAIYFGILLVFMIKGLRKYTRRVNSYYLKDNKCNCKDKNANS